MSSLPEYSEFVSQKAGNLPGEPSFRQTCSLLSKYLKERCTLGDLSLGMTCNTEANGTSEASRHTATTMSLFPIIDKPAEIPSRNMVAPPNLKSMDLFPQQAGFPPSVPKEAGLKVADSGVNRSATMESQAAQMTIFYGGQVIVFNDFPADKAKEIMHLASKGSTQSHTAFTPNLVKSQTTAFAPNIPKSQIEPRSSVPPSPTVIPNFGNNVAQEHIQASPVPVACELPIARRASLHRFLEKRKDRITARVPYQTSRPATGPYKPAESNPWLGLAAQSPQ